MSSLTTELSAEIEELAKLGRTADFFQSERLESGYVVAKGKRLVDFTCWDVLGLRYEKSIKRAFLKAAEAEGINVSASRANSGNSKYIDSCEQRLAEFFGGEAATIFSSRSQAVLSLVLALISEGDLVICDDSVSSPVFDASYLINAESRSFSLNNLKSLERSLLGIKLYKKVFCFMETVSMNSGSVCLAENFTKLMQDGTLNLILDESFALGAIGIRGAGLFEELPVSKNLICKISDLSNIAGTWLACVVGSKTLINLLKARSKTFRLEAAPPAYLMAAIEASLNSIELKHNSRENMLIQSGSLRSGLLELGLNPLPTGAPHIVSVEFNKVRIARDAQTALYNRGFLCDWIANERALSESGLIRFIIQASHTSEQITALLSNLAELKGRLIS
ncbi:MAG: aminotransferase class I/II-fold pyridoxal phosphate-dependent enzyme [Bdellovibrionota bacterium]